MNYEGLFFDEKLIQKLLRVEFVEAKMKPTAKKKGVLVDYPLKLWLRELRDAHKTNEDFASEIHYHLKTDLPIPVPLLQGQRGTAAASRISFICLDVGAWVGSKDGKWGRDDNNTGKYIKRDFGVICGPLVLLCTFDYAYNGPRSAEWEKQKSTPREPWKSVSKLIETLSTAAGAEVGLPEGEALGRVIVRDLMWAPASNPRWPKHEEDYVIHVVLGDMHVPVLDDNVQTYGSDAYGAHGAPKAPVAEIVPRRGRLDLGTMEMLTKLFVGQDDATFLKNYAKLVSFFIAGDSGLGAKAMRRGLSAAFVALGAVPLAGGLFASQAARPLVGDSAGVEANSMKSNDAGRWHTYYRSGEKKDQGTAKPADIFEHAGDHFLLFIARLTSYVRDQREDDSLLPVRFLQLGDMLDFWVGFTCHYSPAPNNNQPISAVSEYGQDLIKHWTRNMFGNTKQGKSIADALELAKSSALAQTFLFGNHDNYLGAGQRVTYPFKRNPDTPLAARDANYDRLGLFMEHGHQWEPSNADSAKPLAILGQWTGTPSPLGLFVTQAAFIRPEPVRLFEGTAAGVVARASNTFGQRLDQIIGAGFRFLAASGGFYCYVMGHTHSACLTEVVISTKEQSSTDKLERDLDKDKSSEVYFTDRGSQTRNEELALARGKSSVKVEWRHMPGDPESEWIGLRYVYANPGGLFTNEVKGLAVPNDGGPSGVVTFNGVPAGAYVARYYLTRAAAKPFKQTTNRLLILGMSIRGDAEHAQGYEFSFDQEQQKFNRAIVLQWAFEKKGFNPKDAWVGLYRKGEPDDRVSLVDPNAPPELRRVHERGTPRPAYRFSTFNRGTPWWGVIDLTERHPSGWDQGNVAGEWELRAFMDAAWKQPLGVANFKVVKAKPHAHKT